MIPNPLRYMTFHIPPKYNLYGERQIWFLETGHRTLDNIVNGTLLGLNVMLIVSVLLHWAGIL